MGTLHSIADQRKIRDFIKATKVVDTYEVYRSPWIKLSHFQNYSPGADLVEFMVDDFKKRISAPPKVLDIPPMFPEIPWAVEFEKAVMAECKFSDKRSPETKRLVPVQYWEDI